MGVSVEIVLELNGYSVVRVEGRHPALHAGFYAASDFSVVTVNAAEVVRRAETALQYALMGGTEGTLSFDELPGNG
jgi:hypothetical protein